MMLLVLLLMPLCFGVTSFQNLHKLNTFHNRYHSITSHKFTETSFNYSCHKNRLKLFIASEKQEFLDSLDHLDKLNLATEQRSSLMKNFIDNKITIPLSDWDREGSDLQQGNQCRSLEKPGLHQTFNFVAKGNWKVIYAPHMTTIAGLLGGTFDVQYNLNSSSKMESHAKFDFPVVGRGFLSVSGTYGSVDENICRVDFDKAWIKLLASSQFHDKNEEDTPYPSLDDVPDSPIKRIINAVGNTMFIEQFSVFPISFLDEDLIVFDFPLLGTRVCALKQ